jgi:hypothetical protein
MGKKKIRDDEIHLRVAGTLRAELEGWAAEESRGLSALVRKLLLGCVTQRIVERASGADAGAAH